MLMQARNLSVRIGKAPILTGINLHVERGDIVTIIGPNGSGKSTLLRTLIGALTPSEGQVISSPGLSIGYVPQRLHIDETLPMTVKRFLQLPHRVSSDAIQAAMANAGVPGLLEQQLMSLSGGQLQRVLLARALLDKPDLLLLDEPTQGLDRRGTADFYRHIDISRQALNCAVIMVSHDLQVVMRQSERVICLNGHICCEGKPEVVSNSAEYRALFGFEDDEDTLALYSHRGHNHRPDSIREAG
ncbi:metal ABC transporter ATP-binding protein [Marinobacter sp. 1_MG-2023]|uniref:ATP-binding cassette domain-containing protein n=1 Tax=Marinobacter sp. 1_MG-2023 TaxID=3062627 RepID=UPI0026E471B4|nr:metal ABC transporter ATP-binding protein [Marinobacter sp. 1_MG-2023]MDO6824887.1 metal ABC transporter ATP-binding protein [Marinobacter sp. 1_MG-2023]